MSVSLPTLKKDYFLVIAPDLPGASANLANHDPERQTYNASLLQKGYTGENTYCLFMNPLVTCLVQWQEVTWS